MHKISISLFINVDGIDYYFTGSATNLPPTPSCNSRTQATDYIDIPTRVVKESRAMAQVIPIRKCKLLGG